MKYVSKIAGLFRHIDLHSVLINTTFQKLTLMKHYEKDVVCL